LDEKIFLPSPTDACRYQPLPRLQTDKHCDACGDRQSDVMEMKIGKVE
jgi:hypothetical protein